MAESKSPGPSSPVVPDKQDMTLQDHMENMRQEMTRLHEVTTQLAQRNTQLTSDLHAMGNKMADTANENRELKSRVIVSEKQVAELTNHMMSRYVLLNCVCVRVCVVPCVFSLCFNYHIHGWTNQAMFIDIESWFNTIPASFTYVPLPKAPRL